jgi:hypothetical protein
MAPNYANIIMLYDILSIMQCYEFNDEVAFLIIKSTLMACLSHATSKKYQ